MNLPIRLLFLATATALFATACETHQRAPYSNRPPKNLRVIRPGETPAPEAALPPDMTTPPTQTSETVPTSGSPSSPASAQ